MILKLSLWMMLLAVLLAAIIIGFLWRWGTSEIRRDYEHLYYQLKLYVENCKVNAETKAIIALAFKEINKFKCRNNEKLDVLYRQYKRKFKKI